VEATEKANDMFAAKIGTCYVSMTVTIKNKDRGGSLNLGNVWNFADWTVTYNGEEYDMHGFDLNTADYNKIRLDYGAIVDKATGKVLVQKCASCNERSFSMIKIEHMVVLCGRMC
jgi:hypothetical protein